MNLNRLLATSFAWNLTDLLPTSSKYFLWFLAKILLVEQRFLSYTYFSKLFGCQFKMTSVQITSRTSENMEEKNNNLNSSIRIVAEQSISSLTQLKLIMEPAMRSSLKTWTGIGITACLSTGFKRSTVITGYILKRTTSFFYKQLYSNLTKS